MWLECKKPTQVTSIKVWIYNRILLSHREEWNNAICSNVDGPRDYHTKWSKPDRERQILYDIAYMCNLKKKKNTNWTYLQNRNRPADIENKFVVTKGEGIGEG